MPPKPKFTKEEITDCAFELVRSDGPDALTAREVGKRLGVSSSPIFTFFKDMDELKQSVAFRAKSRFDDYMKNAEEFYPAYKKRGLQFVKFATEEPKLFELLFMQNTGGDLNFKNAMSIIPFGRENDISIIKRDYKATDEQAERLFEQMWIYSYGLCVLSAQGVCKFSEEEAAKRLGEMFRGMIFVISTDAGRVMNTAVIPKPTKDSVSIEMKKLGPDLSIQK